MSPTPASGPRWAIPFHELALLLAIGLVFGLTGLADGNHTYFTKFNESAIIILRNTSLLGIMALGAAVVIIAGGIDLSSGSMVAFSATTCALVMVLFAEEGDKRLATVGSLGVICGISAGVLAGFLVGTLHTWLVTAIKLPPFVATLATLVGLRSFARAMCEFVTKQEWGNSANQINVNAPFFLWLKQHNVWISTGVFLVLAVFTWIILSRTVLGRHIYALGGNEQAARLSGIRTENIKWFAYCFGAVTASIAGIFAMADGSVAQPVNLARGYELNAIAAAVVGGCSLQGGIGTVTGTVLGTLFLRLVIDAVAKLIKSNADVYEGMIVGIVVALAVTLTQVRQLVRNGGEFFAGTRGIAAIPTLALAAGLLAMMSGANVDSLKGWLYVFGAAVGFAALIALSAIKLIEVKRRRGA
ncbi:MAG: ABC transporter permease [Pirellulaceae bacterium]|jgi:ribose/xylose/arabinose/galactoside ABC-type transport system permease subunit|nr:ABC transporter permease [Pirellulaceae bacterium]